MVRHVYTRIFGRAHHVITDGETMLRIDQDTGMIYVIRMPRRK